MKRNTCYIIAGICAVITAVFLVANINLAGVSGVEQEKIHREREMSADNGHDSKGIESVNDNAERFLQRNLFCRLYRCREAIRHMCVKGTARLYIFRIRGRTK